jgi:hypothetical protein
VLFGSTADDGQVIGVRLWVPLVLGAAMGIAACGSVSRSASTTVSNPTTTGASSSSTSSDSADVIEISVYFLRTERVALVHRSVPHTSATSKSALEQLLSGPTPAEAQLGMTTSVPLGTVLNKVSLSAGIATVDLSASYASGGSMRTRLAQVVYTLTQFPTVQGVLFEQDGQPVTSFGSEGVVLDHPLSRADFETETPGIFVDGPAPFDAVDPKLRVYGTANVFEATFVVRITDPTGHQLYEHFQMATSGTGTRGTFDFTIDVATATHGTGTIRLWEPSVIEQGPDINVVEIPVRL